MQMSRSRSVWHWNYMCSQQGSNQYENSRQDTLPAAKVQYAIDN